MSARTIMGTTARRALRIGAVAYDRLSPPPPGAVVLAYHQVGAPVAGSVNLTPSAFADQVALIADGADVRPAVGLDEVVARVAPAGIGAHPDLDTVIPRDPATDRDVDCVSITFDDGTADFVDHALPVLVRHQVPVTLYLATAHVDEGRSFWDDGTVLSWAALRDACSTGVVTIGSHTHDHILLDRTDPADVEADLDRSIGRIEDELGVTATHFAYPKALAPSAAAKALVRARFASAAVAGGRPNEVGRTDLWALDRTPVVAGDSIDDVAGKIGGGLRLEAAARAVIDRIRYRGASQ